MPIPDPVVEREREAILLAGDLPSPANPPPACRFHTRCPFIQPTRCRDEIPRLRKLSGGHEVACHWAEEIKEGRIKPRERDAVLEAPRQQQLEGPPPGDQRRRSEHRAVHLCSGPGWEAGSVQVCPAPRVIARLCARIALAIAAALAAGILSGCGSVRAQTPNEIGGERLTIYLSVPLYGASSVRMRSSRSAHAGSSTGWRFVARLSPRIKAPLKTERSVESTRPNERWGRFLVALGMTR